VDIDRALDPNPIEAVFTSLVLFNQAKPERASINVLIMVFLATRFFDANQKCMCQAYEKWARITKCVCF
jgi:hypothetical protein